MHLSILHCVSYALEASKHLVHLDCFEMHAMQHTLQICCASKPQSFRLLHWCQSSASILNQSHICQARHPTLTCGSFNHICSQLRLENQVSCGLHITATLSPGHQHDMHKHLNSPSISKEPYVTSFSGYMQIFRKAVVTPKSSNCCQSTGPAKSRNSV